MVNTLLLLQEDRPQGVCLLYYPLRVGDIVTQVVLSRPLDDFLSGPMDLS